MSLDLAVFHVFTEATVSSQDAQPAEQSTARAATRSLSDAGSCSSSDCSFASLTVSSKVTTCYRVSHSARKGESKEPDIVPS